jgi:hypothetical protein
MTILLAATARSDPVFTGMYDGIDDAGRASEFPVFW